MTVDSDCTLPTSSQKFEVTLTHTGITPLDRPNSQC